MTGDHHDPIADFYDRHPYPPPVDDLGRVAAGYGERERRLAHHLVWPDRSYRDAPTVLIAGCGTSQAARYAIRHPRARMVGIDVSETSLARTRELVERHGLKNLELHRLPIERVGELETTFDQVVCTGVLHHLAEPERGLAALRQTLAERGSLTLMVYAPYGRTGVSLMQGYCRRLGVTTSPDDIADLVATLREMPMAHPLSHLLRQTRDFQDDDALADALLNPRDRAYSVPELFELLASADLRFGRWVRQAPYLPDCGSLAETPHGARIAALPPAEQYAAVELFRGTMTRHSLIAFAAADTVSGGLDFDGPAVDGYVPMRARTAISVTERLPPGCAAALLNSAHSSSDLVMFADPVAASVFESIDGRRSIADLGPEARGVVERLWRHDLVVVDASAGAHR